VAGQHGSRQSQMDEVGVGDVDVELYLDLLATNERLRGAM